MKTLTTLMWLGLSITSVISATTPQCVYSNDIRTYKCQYIRNTFPKIFYGNYYLQCDNCIIKVFSHETFPYENSLLSLNVSNSRLQYITTGAFSIFKNVQHIYLQDNKIVNVSANAFSGLKQVYVINLERNNIVHLTPGFVNDLETNSLILSDNRIEVLPEKVFVGVLNLLTLNLDKNNINKIHRDAFSGIDSLEYLELQNNNLCHLPLGLFKNLGSLRVLNLAGNKLARFSLGTFSGLTELNGLILANNSIKVFEGTDLLPLQHLTKLDLSGNNIYYLDSNGIYSNAPSVRFLHIEDNVFSCQLLINVLQYFKSKRIDVVSSRGRYDVQNINGIACIEPPILQPIPFDFFLEKVYQETKNLANTC